MATSGYSPDLDAGSSVSSLVSPIRYGPSYQHSIDSWSSSEPSNGSDSVYQDPLSGDVRDGDPPNGDAPSIDPPSDGPTSEQRSVMAILAGSDGSSAFSSDANSAQAFLSQDSRSQVSGTTIYSDARDEQDLERESSEAPRQPSEQPEGTGLVSVTPLRSSLRDSFVFNASDLDLRNPRPFLPADTAQPDTSRASTSQPNTRAGSAQPENLRADNIQASTTSFMASPSTPTPRLRKDPRKPRTAGESIPPGNNIHEILIEPKAPAGGAASAASAASLGSPSRNTAQQRAARASGDVLALHRLSSRGIKLILGKPRVPSDNGSDAATHASSQADSHGHIEPSRKVNEVPLSYIRRAGAMIYTNTPIYAGIPRLPVLPIASSTAGPKEKSSLLPETPPRDIWGRKQASTSTALGMLLLCTVFPPSWLLLGTGYFDHLAGPIPRFTKLVALVLSLAILAAGTSLVIVFSILRD